ncbi:MAG: VanW family protein [Coriobacteriia bacterium]|nr:VanW family protein [Coriobacteriia bacterium]
MQWLVVGPALSRQRSSSPLPFPVTAHRTPLVRPLSGLDARLQANKVVNLRLAAGRLDGFVLGPGERLSFWKIVGKPSSRRGFLEGLVLDHGRLSQGVGGGLCQMTNLLYWMTLHTPLMVVERWRHSYDVFPDAGRTQPFGSGATCSWPSLDLQIVNPTAASFRLSVEVDDTHLLGRWSSDRPSLVTYEIEERAHKITHEGPGIYVRHNELWRVEIDQATSIRNERLVAANDALMMYAPFLPPAGSDGA